MRRTCQWLVLDTDDAEVPCGRPAVAHITWPGSTNSAPYWSNGTFWYCARHYDERMAFIRSCGRTDVLRANGAA